VGLVTGRHDIGRDGHTWFVRPGRSHPYLQTITTTRGRNGGEGGRSWLPLRSQVYHLLVPATIWLRAGRSRVPKILDLPDALEAEQDFRIDGRVCKKFTQLLLTVL